MIEHVVSSFCGGGGWLLYDIERWRSLAHGHSGRLRENVAG